MRIEERILYHLGKRQMSRNKLAERAGISRSGLASILSGQKSPTFDTLTKLCGAMDIEVEELFAEEDGPGEAGERRLLRYYRSNDDYGRSHILESARAFYTVHSQKLEEEGEPEDFPAPDAWDLPAGEELGETILVRQPGELPWVSLEDACARINPDSLRIEPEVRDFALACGERTPYLLPAARPGQLVFFRPSAFVGLGETALVRTAEGRLALAHNRPKERGGPSGPFVEREEGGYVVPGCRILGRLLGAR